MFRHHAVLKYPEHEREGKRVPISKEEWAHIYSAWIKKAVESFTPHKFRCVRSPAAPGNFIRGIVRDLYDSDIVIADLTGSRANVYYELGIRHAMETGTIMITQDLASVPSDLHGYYTFQYHYTSEHHEYARAYADFEEQLHDKMVYIFDNLNPSDNPVSDFLGHSNEYLRQSFEGERNELVLLAKLLQDAVLHNYDLCDTIVKLATTGEHPEGAPPLVFDFFPFDLLLSRLVNTQWHFNAYADNPEIQRTSTKYSTPFPTCSSGLAGSPHQPHIRSKRGLPGIGKSRAGNPRGKRTGNLRRHN